MGSQELSSYTAIGDTVNLAARLEAKNKELEARIVCSDATYSLAPEVVEALPTHSSIRGLDEEVRIWIVRGLRGESREDEWSPRVLSQTAPPRPRPEPQSEEPSEPPMLALPHGAPDEHRNGEEKV
jgi:adenylate cyclase